MMFIIFLVLACIAAAVLGDAHALRDQGYTYPQIARRYVRRVRR